MAKFIRYALASVCFAASVGCLALWGWSATHSKWEVAVSHYAKQRGLHFEAIGGFAILWTGSGSSEVGWKTQAVELGSVPSQAVTNAIRAHGYFGWPDPPRVRFLHFPLWYPALVFALASATALRFRRQFSIRSALIAVSVVAVLLGIVVVL